MTNSTCGDNSAAPRLLAPLPTDRWVSIGLLAGLAGLCGLHAHYVLASGLPPSWDEAQYLSAAYGFADGLRAGEPGLIWHGWAAVLEKKPPLIVLPVGVAVAVFGESPKVGLLTLIPIFAGLTLSAYALFRHGLNSTAAAAAALILATAPMITGLTHRLYVETLLLWVTVAFLDTLVRGRSGGWGWAAAAGALLGAGMLAKGSFPLIAGPPALWLLGRTVADIAGEPDRSARRRRWGELLARVGLMAGIALILSLSWYGRNFRRMLAHVEQSSFDPILGYDGWSATLAFVSHGPHFFVFLLAVPGVVVVLRELLGNRFAAQAQAFSATASAEAEPSDTGPRLKPDDQLQTTDELRPVTRDRVRFVDLWGVLIVLAVVTALACSVALSKMLRPTIPWLPSLSAFAAAAVVGLLPRRVVAAGLVGVVGLSGLLCVHNCHDILPVGPVRVGDLSVLDSRFCLNVPDWYRDNVPLDRRAYPVVEVVEAIAGDAAGRRQARGWPPLPPRARLADPGWRDPSYQVRLTFNNLVANDHLFHLLARRERAWYLKWPEANQLGLPPAEYVVVAVGLERHWPGRMNADYAPGFAEQADAGRGGYRRLCVLPGPDGSEFRVYVRLGDWVPGPPPAEPDSSH